jgi:hypothetical protein
VAEKVGRKLVFGFIGADNIHRDNAVALLDDLIAQYHRNNKGAEVVLYLACDPFTHTMADLADYALTSGYKLGLVGTETDLVVGALKPFLADAEGQVIRVTGKHTVPEMLVETISVYAKEARLILIADPNEDDDTYNAVIAATAKEIKVRTLLGGLDEVTLEPDDEEEETAPVPAEPEVEPESEEYDDPQDLDDLAESDLSEDADVVDPDEEEGDIVDAELVESGDGALPEDSDNQNDPENNSDHAEAEEPAAEPVEEEPVAEATETKPAPAKKATKATKTVKKVVSKSQTTPLNADALLALAESDRPAFYELAAEYNIKPGKGIKVLNMVNRILAATGGTPALAPAKKAPATKKAAPAKAVAKKAPAPVKKTAPAKAVAKKAAAPKATAGTATLKQTGPSLKTVRAATKLVEAALLLLTE